MSSTTRRLPLAVPLALWGGVILLAVLVLFDQLTFGYGPGDYYYSMTSIVASGVIGFLCLRASADLRLILSLLGIFYLLFLIAKVTIIQGPMVL